MSKRLRCTHTVDIFKEGHIYEEVEGILYKQGQIAPLNSMYHKKYPEYFIELLPSDIEDIEPTEIDIKLDALERRFEKLHKMGEEEEADIISDMIQELEELSKDHL